MNDFHSDTHAALRAAKEGASLIAFGLIIHAVEETKAVAYRHFHVNVFFSDDFRSIHERITHRLLKSFLGKDLEELPTGASVLKAMADAYQQVLDKDPVAGFFQTSFPEEISTETLQTVRSLLPKLHYTDLKISGTAY